jgi:hypothetical protein
VPEGTGIRDVAPTLASILGFRVPHPEVRSGKAVEGIAGGTPPRLILLVAWKGVGSLDLEATPDGWPSLRRLLDEGAGTLDGSVGSLPLDEAAILATLGTGGLPSEHGITGAILREGRGVVRAGSRGASVSVIATLADDLDQQLGQRPRIGLVGTRVSDRGAIGGNWYLEGDRDDSLVHSEAAGARTEVAEGLLRSGYGSDRVPDLLVVAVEGSVARLDDALSHLIGAARRASGGSVTVAVVGTGSAPASTPHVPARTVAEDVERRVAGPENLIQGVAPGGLFLDQAVLQRTGLTSGDVLRVLRGLRNDDGSALLADAFPGVAVTLARYC